MKTFFSPFTSDMIPEAARLLAARHARNRTKLPLLPIRFEDPQTAAIAIEALWKEKLKAGYAAFRGGTMIAYLIGDMTTRSWGRDGYVYLPGYAIAQDGTASVLQDLYCLLGEDWIKRGYFNHAMYVSAGDEDVIESLFDVGFGKERVDALMDLRPQGFPEVDEPVGVTIRKAGPGDNALIGSMSDVIFRALATAPYWHPTVPEDWEELREGWSELADDKEWAVWLALENEQALSVIGFCPEPEADKQMLASPRTVYLSVAATKPTGRGRGLSTALTWHGLKRSQQKGYEICYTNWISPNLLASRFWPRFGFTDVAYRLSKKVNPMIAWSRDA